MPQQPFPPDHPYRRTDYRVPELGLVLQIGDPFPDLDTWMTEAGLHAWAFVTAWNPGSELVPRAENEKRQAELRMQLRHYRVFDAIGKAQTGDWPAEPSFLVLGISRPSALAIGRAFGQLAILYGRRGGRVELLATEL